MSIISGCILNSMHSLLFFLQISRLSHFDDFAMFVTQSGVRSVQLLFTNLAALFCMCSIAFILVVMLCPMQHIQTKVLLLLNMLLL